MWNLCATDNKNFANPGTLGQTAKNIKGIRSRSQISGSLQRSLEPFWLRHIIDRPLQLHPSPKDENRRLIRTVDRKAGYLPTFSQLDGGGDPPPSPPQSSPPVTPPRFSRPYPHPPPLSPTAKSELTMIPPKSENYCCHCRTECPCTFGNRCRGCPARQGGRPHHCDRCPGNWCHIKPPNFL